LANKAALSCRVDALGDEDTKPNGVDNLNKIAARMQQVDGKKMTLPVPTFDQKYEKPATSAVPEYASKEDVAGQFVPMETDNVEKKKRKRSENSSNIEEKETDKETEEKPTKKKKRSKSSSNQEL